MGLRHSVLFSCQYRPAFMVFSDVRFIAAQPRWVFLLLVKSVLIWSGVFSDLSREQPQAVFLGLGKIRQNGI